MAPGLALAIGKTPGSLWCRRLACLNDFTLTRMPTQAWAWHPAWAAPITPDINRVNYFRVWTSTDSTGGRSRTIGDQVSPESGEAYTCPPVVPKYMPHSSSESMAIASRSTLT